MNQLMKIAFDEEVSPDDVEAFRKLSTKYRSPTTVFMTFAFCGQAVPQPSAMLKPIEKNASLKLVISSLYTQFARHMFCLSRKVCKITILFQKFCQKDNHENSKEGRDSKTESTQEEICTAYSPNESTQHVATIFSGLGQ